MSHGVILGVLEDIKIPQRHPPTSSSLCDRNFSMPFAFLSQTRTVDFYVALRLLGFHWKFYQAKKWMVKGLDSERVNDVYTLSAMQKHGGGCS